MNLNDMRAIVRWQLSKIILLAVLYIATGKIGLSLAVPPGYATIIWPPSGIALGMLIVHGFRLWPGVLIGSLLLNCYISQAYTTVDGIDYAKTITAIGIAIGSTLQAVTGRWLIKRFISIPLALNSFKQLLQLFLLSGPIACVIAATIGTASLHFSNVLLAENILKNWSTWWMGDVFGILIFLPLVLIAPNKDHPLIWRGNALGTLPVVAMLVLIMPLGLTFYAWKIASETIYQKNLAEFESLSVENEKSLLYRLDSYEHALLSAEGFFKGSDYVSREDWRRYTETIDIKESFPGINGIGWVKPVMPKEINEFQNEIRKKGKPSFTIYPTNTSHYYVITYIEPEFDNYQAIGLNLAFEEARFKACNIARDTGKSAITSPIKLVQDAEKNFAFLLMHPMYHENMPINSEKEKQAAFIGWIYAPFIAKNFLRDLTRSQNHFLNIRVYDGINETKNSLIYESSEENKIEPLFTIRKTISVFQRQWLIVWESTSTYEQNESSDSPIFILAGGLLLTCLFGMFLIVSLINQTEKIEEKNDTRCLVLPICVFILLTTGSYLLYTTLKEKEINYIKSIIDKEASKIKILLNSQAHEKLTALKRMAQRWEIGNGTPYNLWRSDAKNYIHQLNGLEKIQWINPNFKTQWVEPFYDNEVFSNKKKFNELEYSILKEAETKKNSHETFLVDSDQDDKKFIFYVSLHTNNKFNGFIAGTFSIDEFFGRDISTELGENYAVAITNENQLFFKNHIKSYLAERDWSNQKKLKIYDEQWTIEITPTSKYIKNQQSLLPIIIFFAGLVIAGLSALVLRSILISRIKSLSLNKLNQLNQGILSSTDYLIISTDKNGVIVTFNKAAEEALGYNANEVIGKHTPALWHKPEEIIQCSIELGIEFDKHFEPGFEVFTFKANRYGIDSREWTFIRKNCSVFSVNLTVTKLLDHNGSVTGYLGVIEDITEKKAQNEALKTSEETFRSAMQYASIGIALVKPNGQWLKVNQALCDLTGYEDSELLEIDFQSITHPADLAKDLEFVQKMLAGEIKTYQMEKRYIHKNGKIIPILLSGSLVRDTMLQPKYFIAQIQDMTERKRVERLKNEFISVVSHELRTPITSIRGSLELIISAFSKDLPEKVKKLIFLAHNNCERLIHIVNDILDIEKIASGKMRFDMRQESLALITKQAVELNESYAQKFSIRLKIESMDESLKVNIDSTRYFQIMSNLISNAVKFSPTGESVKIFITPLNNSVRISVQDNGPGISEEFRSRIFEKFSQADSSLTRRNGGTGLGLNITKKLVEQMRGIIGFDSEYGKGTIFWIEFPFVKNILENL